MLDENQDFAKEFDPIIQRFTQEEFERESWKFFEEEHNNANFGLDFNRKF